MSLARTNPEILDAAEGINHVAKEGLILPMLSFTKSEIAERVETWLNDALEEHDASQVYVMLKQMEEAITTALDKTKPVAFESMATAFGGQTKGEILGHDVKLSYTKTWIYSEAVSALKERQKAELKAAQLTEQANGTATQTTEPGRITVTLKKGKE